jgi:hypothetical protein
MPAVDPDGDALNWRVVSGPSMGSLRDLDARRGTFTYVPQGVGNDEFSFRASDGRLDSNLATVRIVVLPAALELAGPATSLSPGGAPGLVGIELADGRRLVGDFAAGTTRPVAGGGHPTGTTGTPTGKARAGSLDQAAQPGGGAGRVVLRGPRPTLWWSDDGGRRYSPSRVPISGVPGSVEWSVDGGLVAVANEAGGVRLWVSADNGRSWRPGPGWEGDAAGDLTTGRTPEGHVAVFVLSKHGDTVWMARVNPRPPSPWGSPSVPQ